MTICNSIYTHVHYLSYGFSIYWIHGCRTLLHSGQGSMVPRTVAWACPRRMWGLKFYLNHWSNDQFMMFSSPSICNHQYQSIINKYRFWDHLVRHNAYDGVQEFFVTVRETSERTTETSYEETHKKTAKAPDTCPFSGLATLIDLTGHRRSLFCHDWDGREQVPGLGRGDKPRSGWGQGSSRWSTCGSLHAGLVLPKRKDTVKDPFIPP